MSKVLVQSVNLRKYFPIHSGFLARKKSFVRAVDGVNLQIIEGETLGLVGESGCGKTTYAFLLLNLIQPTSGAVLFEGMNISEIKGEELKSFRQQTGIVFQSPYGSLDPRRSVKEIVGRSIKIHHLADSAETSEKVAKLIEKVNLDLDVMDKYPHELSGGQRQRVAIARALSMNPKYIVLDEPTSSLDVSVQANILNDLKRLQNESGLTYLFVSHDLRVVKHMSHKIAVMYLGRIVELAPSNEIFRHALHPYAQALLSAIPIPDPALKKQRIILAGDVPSPATTPRGCSFHPRCPYSHVPGECSLEIPELVEIEKNHFVACHIWTKGSIFEDAKDKILSRPILGS